MGPITVNEFIVCILQADAKLREEEKRALRYLETRRECNSVQAVSVLDLVLVCFCPVVCLMSCPRLLT